MNNDQKILEKLNQIAKNAYASKTESVNKKHPKPKA